LSISDRLNHAFVWFTVSLFCVLFALIYNIFSHGVHSPYMTYLFAIPLVLGVGVNLAAVGIGYVMNKLGVSEISAVQSLNSTVAEKGSSEAAPKNSILSNIATNLYYSGIAALTASSMLRGIFDIAGTASVYQTYLMYAGIAMTIGGAVMFLLGLFFRRLH
jgi:hypothetical protein